MKGLSLAVAVLFAVTRAFAVDLPPDPYLWLEEVEAPKSLDWVRARNARSLARLEKDPRYPEVEAALRKIYTAKDKLPYPSQSGGWITNFWRDENNPKGLWRRATLEEYRKAEPNWDVVLDIDELSRNEKESWVYQGGQCLPPEYDRCLIHLSRGGKDASVVREFDVPAKSFVAGGFTLPEAKSSVGWLDRDRIWVGTDFGPGSMTKSGYPRIVKIWKRGTPLSSAKTIYEGKESDVSVSGSTSWRPEGRVSTIQVAPSFFESMTFVYRDDGKLARIPYPIDGDYYGFFQGHFMFQLRTDWKTGAKTFPAGSLVSMPMAKLEDPSAHESVELIAAADERSSISGLSASRSRLYISMLENVKGRIYRADRTASGWSKERIPLPDNGSTWIVSTDGFRDDLFISYTDFLTPDSIYHASPSSAVVHLEAVKRLPERFDARGFEVSQYEARSADGTMIPYFVVQKRGLKADGGSPTILNGYGGFEISMSPRYQEARGKVWLEKGGVYALANIRGGGEFGPKWHQAAKTVNRQKAFDDFIAVAEDLVARKITSPSRLGIMGGSNGGLLVGAAFTQRPELFKAVVCGVPLFDMMRFHKLLAGASWVGEYGDPDDPVIAPAILKYSPYQNLRSGKSYPKLFFVTSTKDDRVHPGHARKAAARMEELGQDVLYYENIEGGHSAAADLEQRIKMDSLTYIHFFQQLADKR